VLTGRIYEIQGQTGSIYNIQVHTCRRFKNTQIKAQTGSIYKIQVHTCRRFKIPKYRCRQVAYSKYRAGAHMKEIQNTKIKVQTDRKCKMLVQASRINKIQMQKGTVGCTLLPYKI
jgi:hypothetical protein